MNCNDVQRRLRLLAETHEPPQISTSELAEHAAVCPHGCAEAWREHQLLARATTAWRASVPRADLTQRVVRQLREREAAVTDRSQPAPHAGGPDRLLRHRASKRPSPGRPSGGGRAWGAVGMVVASLVLLALLLSLNSSDRSMSIADRGVTHQPSIELAADRPQVPQAVEQSSPAGPQALRPSGIRNTYGSAYAKMPLSATEFMTDAVVLVVPADLSGSDDEAPRGDHWSERLGRQLEPIGKELSSALETLRQVVPKMSSSST